MVKCVTFNPTVIVIKEPPHLAQALHEARKNNLFQWRVDCARLQKRLCHILSPSHREKVLQQRLHLKDTPHD